ncbi:hypothetical protein EJB05_14165, partial [Eragrostis curvula]
MAPPRRPCPPPALMDDVVGEILLRVPPEEPAHLVRASLVCKPWLRRLSDPAFLRRYREFHRTPPLLGFLHNLLDEDEDDSVTVGLVPTTAASPLSPPALGCTSSWALDCRHGRVLIHTLEPVGGLVVWDPITGDQKQVPLPEDPHAYCTGAVLCAVAGCDHLACCGGPFLVVFVGSEDDGEDRTWASVYSSETGVWSASANLGIDSYVEMRPSNLTRDALYFILELGKSILKFDLGEQTLSVINPPQVYEQRNIVMTSEDGELGFAGMKGKNLQLWSWEDGDADIAGWMLRRVIELDGLIPIRNESVLPDVIGFVEGTHTIFISTDAGVFTLNLKSRKVKKVGEEGSYVAVLPYTSFYAPGCH